MSSEADDTTKLPPSRPNIPCDLLDADEGQGLMQDSYALRTNVAFAWLCRGNGRSAERDFQGSPTRWRFARS